MLENKETAKKHFDSERGEGIATIRRLVTDIKELKGELIIMSGNAAAYISHTEKNFLSFPLDVFKAPLLSLE